MIRDQGHPEVFGQLDLLRSYLYPDPTNDSYLLMWENFATGRISGGRTPFRFKMGLHLL